VRWGRSSHDGARRSGPAPRRRASDRQVSPHIRSRLPIVFFDIFD
jgi:hypothetical protein